MITRRWRSDDGAAVVDFVMISILLIFLLFAVLQVAVYFYARNVTAASAADAARHAAAETVDPTEGGSRASALIHDGLDDADAGAIRCIGRAGRDTATGLPTAVVRCVGHVRLLFTPLGLPLPIDVTSTVLKEQTP